MAIKIKKQYKQPDGTIIEVEGDEAEIEAYERKQSKKAESVQRQKRLLTEEVKKVAEDTAKKTAQEEIQKFKDRDILKEFREFLDKLPKQVERHDYHHYPAPYIPAPVFPYRWAVPCPFCGSYSCNQTHIWCGTTTTDQTLAGDQLKITAGDPPGSISGGSVSGNNVGRSSNKLYAGQGWVANSSPPLLKS